MKTIFKIAILAFAAVWMAACGAPTTNTSTNTNTNTTKPTAAAPTADALLALDKQANEAFIKGDSKFFEGMLSDKFVMYGGGQRMDKPAVIKMIAGNKCDVKSWNLEDPQMAKIDRDTYALSYKGTFDGTCAGTDGKSMKLPSPVRAASLWVRSGEKWLAVYHGEVPIVDPKNLPKAAPAAPARKEEPKEDDSAAANSGTTATKPAADPNTEAMMAIEKSLWEAWKARDNKKIEELTIEGLSFVNVFGMYFGNKADALKDWQGNCDITSINLTDSVGTTLSPTVGILTSKASAEGSCYGEKLAPVPIYATSVYVKDGGAWKLAFGLNRLD
ncbi:MAG: nuclear transport factor 2 family protein [Acidobacteriota bacterium]|nr:nuclear transport factor 2 family protein [Acidobacteriota bacterium]